jgi:hypothetical protein
MGEQLPVAIATRAAPVALDTFVGPVKAEWDTSSPLTPLGQLVYFIEFLKVSGRRDAVIDDCSFICTRPNDHRQ